MALVTTLLWVLNQNVLIGIIIFVNFLVCRKTRGDNCLLVPHTSYTTAITYICR